MYITSSLIGYNISYAVYMNTVYVQLLQLMGALLYRCFDNDQKKKY